METCMNNINSSINSEPSSGSSMSSMQISWSMPDFKTRISRIQLDNNKVKQKMLTLEEELDGMFLGYYYMDHPIKTRQQIFFYLHHQQNPLDLLNRQLNLITMPSASSSPILKSEFTEVLIISDLASTSAQTNSKFTTIITKSSLLETNTPLPPSHMKILLILWPHVPHSWYILQFCQSETQTMVTYIRIKFFNSLHQYQWSTMELIKRLRDQAQKLLKANCLQEQHSTLHQQLNWHITTMTCTELSNPANSPTCLHPSNFHIFQSTAWDMIYKNFLFSMWKS